MIYYFPDLLRQLVTISLENLEKRKDRLRGTAERGEALMEILGCPYKAITYHPLWGGVTMAKKLYNEQNL